jgi:hypothetical protein
MPHPSAIARHTRSCANILLLASIAAACGNPRGRTATPVAPRERDVARSATTAVAANEMTHVEGGEFSMGRDANGIVQPGVYCYCLYSVATRRADHPRVAFRGARPTIAADRLLMIVGAARFACAFPATRRAPTLVRVTRDGADVTVHGSYDVAAPLHVGDPTAVLLPAPAPGGNLVLSLEGSILRPNDGHRERCVIPVD